MIKVLKFSQHNCRPCTILSNYLTEIDFEKEGAELVEIDATKSPDLAAKYGVMSTPSMIFERNGHEMARLQGARPVEEIVDAIKIAREAR